MKRLLKFFSAIALAGMLALCLFTWFSSDDICYRNELLRKGVLEKAWLQYLHWDGRSLGIASLIQLTCLKYFSAPVACLIWTSAFIGSGLMILMIARTGHSALLRTNISITEVSILVALMWLGMWKMIPDILYWSTGGWYCMMCLLGLLWVFLFMNDLQQRRHSVSRSLLIFLVSLICSINSHNLVLSLFILALIELAYTLTETRDREAILYCASAILGIAAGALFVLAAPGNGERLKAITWPGFSTAMFYHVTIVFLRYCYWLSGLFALLLLFMWLNGNFNAAAKQFFNTLLLGKGKGNTNRKFTRLVQVLHGHKYLVAMLSTLLVFSATSFFAVPRTALFFGVFLIIYVLQKTQLVFYKPASTRLVYGGTIFLLIFTGIVLFEMGKVNLLHQKLEDREKIYDNSHGNDAVVSVIPDSAIPFAFNFIDISPDTGHWVNRCVAYHYGLKTVRTKVE